MGQQERQSFSPKRSSALGGLVQVPGFSPAFFFLCEAGFCESLLGIPPGTILLL